MKENNPGKLFKKKLTTKIKIKAERKQNEKK